MNINAQQLAAKGFIFNPPGAYGLRGFITPENMSRLAQDAATIPNTSVPAELAAYFDPMVIEILTRPLRSRAVFDEVKKGDWTTPYAKFRVSELTGATEPYADHGQARTVGVNYEWVMREQYVFQTVAQWGDMEEAVSAIARIQLAADKQRAAAHIIDVDANRFALYGVAGRELYGILNQPGLNAPITPRPIGLNNSPLWSDKTAIQQYEDVLHLFQTLVTQTQGYVSSTSPLSLLMSPGLEVELGKITDFGVSVMDMLKKYFSSLAVVSLPEMYSQDSGETMMLIARELNGQKTGQLAFSEKIRAGRIVPELSSMSQKWTAGTFGAIVYQPLAIAQMNGM